MPNLDPVIDRLVNRCLHPDTNLRPNNCAEVLNTLHEFRPEAKSSTEHDIPHVQPGGGPERRTSVRFAVDLTATFVPFHQNMRGHGKPHSRRLAAGGPLAGIARGGCQFRAASDAWPGARTELALVKWVKPGKGGTQIVGCTFVHPLTTHEFKCLI